MFFFTDWLLRCFIDKYVQEQESDVIDSEIQPHKKKFYAKRVFKYMYICVKLSMIVD